MVEEKRGQDAGATEAGHGVPLPYWHDYFAGIRVLWLATQRQTAP